PAAAEEPDAARVLLGLELRLAEALHERDEERLLRRGVRDRERGLDRGVLVGLRDVRNASLERRGDRRRLQHRGAQRAHALARGGDRHRARCRTVADSIPARIVMSPSRRLEAVTFDCWNTLLRERDFRVARAVRAAALVEIAGAAGVALTDEDAAAALARAFD